MVAESLHFGSRLHISSNRVVASNSVWKYWDTGIDLGTTWLGFAFDDSDWPAGPADLVNGDAAETPGPKPR